MLLTFASILHSLDAHFYNINAIQYNTIQYNSQCNSQCNTIQGSFGQVFRAMDNVTQQPVAIKIIKSKKPFLMQAKTEIHLLERLSLHADQHNIGELMKLLFHWLFHCIFIHMYCWNVMSCHVMSVESSLTINCIHFISWIALFVFLFLLHSKTYICIHAYTHANKQND